MMRRDELQPAVREDLFGQAAAHYRERCSLPQDIYNLSDEQTVLNLALVVQASSLTG